MKLIRLTKDTIIKSFDCGDADLNDFILNDAKAFLSKRIAYTFLIIDGENIVAYFSLLNDKVAKTDAANNTWRKLRRSFPHEKHFSSYPAIKLGRFAVSKKLQKSRHRHKNYGLSQDASIQKCKLLSISFPNG